MKTTSYIVCGNREAEFRAVLEQEEKEYEAWHEEKEYAAQELAAKIRASDKWDLDQLEELCALADMADEWRKANCDEFEAVAYAAAEKLGVEI